MKSGVTQSDVEGALAGVIDPHLDADPVSSKNVNKISIEGDSVAIDMRMEYPAAGWVDEYASRIKAAVGAVEGISHVHVHFTTQIVSRGVQKGVQPISGVKNIIAVASGKGGVGKSTLSANLALALAAEGANVGILDADIYGPSQPRMLGLAGKPKSIDGKSMEPMVNHGVQSMSIGFLIDEETPMIWRGPMVTQALEQLLKDTRWSDVDYLIVDLPPGTGDIQLTLSQRVPVTGALIVTTPQDIALLDARKAYKMFEKVEIPVLGVVENMSSFICPNCGHEEHIFGAGGGERMAKQYDLDFLGHVPLARSIREHADSGSPTMIVEPDGDIANVYRSIARHAAARLAKKKKDYSAMFPSITIQNN